MLGSEGQTELDKYTFSNAMALSVKLGVWEASLNRYVDSIEFVIEVCNGFEVTQFSELTFISLHIL
jgi:uncharacterized Rmd1/YagE family protein